MKKFYLSQIDNIGNDLNFVIETSLKQKQVAITSGACVEHKNTEKRKFRKLQQNEKMLSFANRQHRKRS